LLEVRLVGRISEFDTIGHIGVAFARGVRRAGDSGF
jgi:hypothetical protein